VAHNTVSLDEVAQAPQGVSKSIWAGEGADRRVSGTLRLFHSGRHLKAVRATCDSAYPGTVLDRTVCLVEPYLLDVYRVSSAEEHTIDLPLHGRGELTADGTVVAVRESPFKGLGYDHLQGLRQARPETLVRARFTDGERQLNVLQNIPEGGEVFLARDPSKGTEVTSCLLARRRGRTAQFVTVLSAVKGGEPVRDVVAREIKGETWVEIAHSQGTDRLVLPHRLDGAIRLERLDRSGKIVGRDIAEATK
jgi:hypothetical protein